MAQGTSNYRIEDRVSPGSQNGYIRLAAAILAAAAKAAKEGDLDAVQWLLSGDAEILADGIGLSWPHVQKWARARLQLNNDTTVILAGIAKNKSHRKQPKQI